MTASAVYNLINHAGKLTSFKVTKLCRDTYYPGCFLQIDTAELFYYSSLKNVLAEKYEEAEDFTERDLTAAELSPEINQPAAEYWAKLAVGEAQVTAGCLRSRGCWRIDRDE